MVKISEPGKDFRRISRRRRLTAAILMIVLAVACASCTREEQEVPARRAEPQARLTLGLAMQPSSALLLVALEKGYFSAQGLDVRIKPYPSGKRALQEGLFRGDVDVASAAEVPVTLAGFERSDFRIIASLLDANNINRVIARRDRGIEQPADLRGKRVATQRASAVHFFLHLFLLEQGLSEQDVTLSFLQAEELPAALAAGEIDAFSMREPYISQAEQLLGDQALIFAAPGTYEQRELFLAARSFVEQKPELVSKLLRALLQAEDFTRANPESAATIVAKHLEVEPGAIAAILPTLKLKVALEQSLVLLLEDQARWAIKSELVRQTTVPDYLSLIHAESLESVRPAAVTIIK